MNFGTVFEQLGLKFSGLFADNPDRIFEQSWTVLRFGFDPGTDVFGFCGVFWYPNNSVRNREGTKRVPCFLWVRDLGHFVCKNHVNICYLMY